MTDEPGIASDDEARELVALYSLDALDADEARAAAALVATDEALAGEVGANRDALAQLASDEQMETGADEPAGSGSDERVEPESSEASVAVVPSATMREKILSRIALTPQDAPTAPGIDAVTDGGVGPDGDADSGHASAPHPTHRAPTGHRRPRRGVIIAIGAGLGLAAALALFAVIERPGEHDPAPTQVAIEQVLDAGDAERSEVAVGDARMIVVTSPEHRHSVVTVEGMEPPPPGHLYQAWWIREGADPVSAGTLASGSDASTLLEGSADGAQQLALTVEPDGGSEHPTTTPFAAVDLPS